LCFVNKNFFLFYLHFAKQLFISAFSTSEILIAQVKAGKKIFKMPVHQNFLAWLKK